MTADYLGLLPRAADERQRVTKVTHMASGTWHRFQQPPKTKIEGEMGKWKLHRYSPSSASPWGVLTMISPMETSGTGDSCHCL